LLIIVTTTFIPLLRIFGHLPEYFFFSIIDFSAADFEMFNTAPRRKGGPKVIIWWGQWQQAKVTNFHSLGLNYAHLLCSPKGEAYSRCVFHPSITEPCPANNFKTAVAI